MDQVIQQNASVSEELAATAEELSSQAEQLQHTMGFFEVGQIEQEERGEDDEDAAPAPKKRKTAHRVAHLKMPVAAAVGELSHAGATPHAGITDAQDEDFERF